MLVENLVAGVWVSEKKYGKGKTGALKGTVGREREVRLQRPER